MRDRRDLRWLAGRDARATGMAGANRRRDHGGFTLLEVIMGVALISLLFGGIYGIANASVDLGRSVSENRLKEMRASGLVNLLREGFESLPPGSKLDLPRRRGVPGSDGAIRVIDAAGVWAWSGATGAADAVEIFPEAGEEDVDLVLAHLRVIGGGAIDAEGVEFEEFSRTRLVTLESFWWEFFDADSGGWVSDWENGKKRPRLVSVHFALPGDPAVRRHVFAVPPEMNPAGELGSGRDDAPTLPNGDTNGEGRDER